MHVPILFSVTKSLAKGDLRYYIKGEVLGFAAKVEGTEGGGGGQVLGVDEVNEVEEVQVNARFEGGVVFARVLALGVSFDWPTVVKARLVLISKTNNESKLLHTPAAILVLKA